MKKPHFFKARSRIGLKNPPVRHQELNIGVEEGPDYILSPEFLSQFPGHKLDEFNFSKPEDLTDANYYQVLAKELVEFAELINREIPRSLAPLNDDSANDNKAIQVVIGGDNCVTFSSILADLVRYKDLDNYGYIQIDSHGESNLYSTSPSKNFHGMYLRPFFDNFDIPEIEKLVPNKLSPNQALFIGDMVLDGDEPEYFSTMGFRNITREEFLSKKEKVKKELQKFINNCKYLHINFDVDIFDESIALATGTVGDGRWFKEEVFEILKIIAKHPNFSFDLSEVNPKKTGAIKTIKVAQEVLRKVIS